jgi:hypothetical protein
MKKNKRLFLGFLVLVLGAVFVLFLLALLYLYYTPRWRDQKQLLNVPPSILVRSPQAGDKVRIGQYLVAQAIVTSRNPIARVELWLDGEVVEAQAPEMANALSYDMLLDLQLSGGVHMLYWRAVDDHGLVGQTAPIPVEAELPFGVNGTEAISAEEGQNLNDIAEAAAVDPELMDALNPGVGDEALPAGTSVIVPAPSGQAGGGQVNVPGNAPTPPLPQPAAGAAILLPVDPSVLDLGWLIPGLLANMPAAPSHLQAGFDNCTIRLVWNDNATNESYFNIWMQALGGPPLKIKTLERNPDTGQTMFEFASPSLGIYNFWVEATNALGGQPSEIAWVAVNDASCGEGVASQLEIEGLGMVGFNQNWDKIYCYLSLEGAPEMRIPEDDSQFLQIDPGGGADIHQWIGGKNRLLLRTPADEEVTLEGDCWGWLGNPMSMGAFSVSVPKEKWDNRTLQIRTQNYIIDYRIRPFGSTEADGVFTYLDYSIARPEIVSIEAESDEDPIINAERARMPTVTWIWGGNPSEINGFVIYVDGAMAHWSPDGNDRQARVIFPSACGGVYQVQVAAQALNARSPFSQSMIYQQPSCPLLAEVRFLSVMSTQTNDTSCAFPDMSSCLPYNLCDELGVYYMLWAAGTSSTSIRVGTSQMPYQYKCGVEYQFTNQLGAPTDTIIVPIDPLSPEVRFGTRFWESDLHEDDRFGIAFKILPYTYDQWPNVDEEHIIKAPYMDGTADLIVKVHVRGYTYQGP